MSVLFRCIPPLAISNVPIWHLPSTIMQADVEQNQSSSVLILLVNCSLTSLWFRTPLTYLFLSVSSCTVSADVSICKSSGVSLRSGSPSKCCVYVCVTEGGIQESSGTAAKETGNYFSVRKGCWQVGCISHLQLSRFTGQSCMYNV